MTKLIIFDLDGVLVEAKEIHYTTLNKAITKQIIFIAKSVAVNTSEISGICGNVVVG
jgi:beta-phosphoglucomutase-like phosphatase (HAD superfamily)